MSTFKDERSILSVNSGVTFVAAEMGDGQRAGIHVVLPTIDTLERALDRALEEDHKFIWIHESQETLK